MILTLPIHTPKLPPLTAGFDRQGVVLYLTPRRPVEHIYIMELPKTNTSIRHGSTIWPPPQVPPP